MVAESTAQLPKKQVLTHEFVNSLASVRSLAELLAENPGLDANNRSRFITLIRDETQRLERLMGHINLELETTPNM
jgi:signal transduction histidine kinase